MKNHLLILLIFAFSGCAGSSLSAFEKCNGLFGKVTDCDRRERYISKNELSKDIERLIRNGRIRVGMTEHEARASWGNPEKTNKYNAGKTEQWIYGKYKSQYLYVKNGKITDWQSTQ